MSICVGEDFIVCSNAWLLTLYNFQNQLVGYTCNASNLIQKDLLFFNVDDHIDTLLLISSIIMCLLLFIITLPCKFAFKELLSRIISSIDLYPKEIFFIPENENPTDPPSRLSFSAQKNSMDSFKEIKINNENSAGVQIQKKKKYSPIGGCIALQILLVATYAIFFSIMQFNDPRTLSIIPLQQGILGQSTYSNFTQQFILNYRAIVPNCAGESDNCEGSFTFANNLSIYTSPLNFTCKKIDMKYCQLDWRTPVMNLFNPRLNISHQNLVVKYGLLFHNQQLQNTSLFSIQSSLTFWGNFDNSFPRNIQHLKDYMNTQIASDYYAYLYSSTKECFSSNDSFVGFRSSFRRIHFSPLPNSKNKPDLLDNYRDLFSQGVYFDELYYSVGTSNTSYTEIHVLVEDDDNSWFVNRPSYTDIIIRAFIIIGASIPIPTLLRKFIHVTSKMMNSGICGTLAAIVLLICTILMISIFAGYIVVVNETNTFSSLSIISLIYTITLFLCIGTRLLWSIFLNSKSYREVNSFKRIK